MVKIVLKPKYKAVARKGKTVVDVRVRKRGNRRYKKKSLASLASKIAMINCEKKEYNVYSSGLTGGQIYVASAGATPQSGHYLFNGLTPLPNNGTSDTLRIGDEFHITGMRNIFQFSQMSNTGQKMRGKIIMFSPKFGVSGASVSIDKFLNVNPVVYYANGASVSVYDTTSARNLDYVNDFKVIRTVNFTIPADSASLSQKLLTTVDASIKFKKPWKVRFDTAGNLAYGQIWAVVLFESGNSTVNVPNLSLVNGIPITDVSSGANFQYYSKTYFIDP